MTDQRRGEIRERLNARIGALSAVSASGGKGITRLAYSEHEREAHALFAQWIREEGGTVEVDAAGNSVGILSPASPYFLVGSHLDTVVDGGAYDGAAGVVAAIEVARTIAGSIKHGVRAVAFAAEEGARFGRPNLGSSAAAGFLTKADCARLRDGAGISLTEAAKRVGFEPYAVEPWLGPEVACFFEVHIEQGRLLELGAARIGLVDAIAGSVRVRLTIVGRSDHSGATPMRLRADALAAAAEIVLAVEAVGRSYRTTVATVGRLETQPNNVTTVPGRVSIWIDIRDIDVAQQRIASDEILVQAHAIADARHVVLSSEVLSDNRPVVLDSWPRALGREACETRGVSFRVLPSGAGHDAAVAARTTSSMMLFIPCASGVSHSPEESADPEDIALAAEVLAEIVLRADDAAEAFAF